MAEQTMTEQPLEADERVTRYIERTVAEAPELSPAQRDRLCELLRPSQPGGAS